MHRFAPRLLATALLASGCQEDLHFPKGFLFGTATAGFQVEMGCPTLPAADCEDPHSDWYSWVTRPELVQDASTSVSGDPPSLGPGFFELYGADLDRAVSELYTNSFRLSIEWSRLFPTATFGLSGAALTQAASPAALSYYHALFAALKQRNLIPLVTLNHYTLPDWIHDAYGCHVDIASCTARGWLDDRIVEEISKYAGFAAQEFGGEVDSWATLNEPLTAVVLAGYILPSETRSNPPGVVLHYAEAKTAYGHMIEAHARMYDAIKLADTADADGDGRPARVGIVYNLQAVAPDDPTNPIDQTGAKNAAYLMNQAFLDAIGLGNFDPDLSGQFTTRDDLGHRLDYLGVNYYERIVVQGTEGPALPALSSILTFNPLTLIHDAAYPRGIYEVLTFAKRYGIPLVISETGVVDDQDAGLGTEWIVHTLTWVKRAIAAGIPVEGYYYWSLMDNYEWNHGMAMKFGLYAIDPMDPVKTRHARNGVQTFGRIAASGQIPDDLAAKYPAN